MIRRKLDSVMMRAPLGDSADWRAADSLLRADPARELATALGRGDRRFLAYGSVALIVPGVDSLEDQCARKAYALGVRQLDNTTDVVSTRAQEWLKYAAGQFAGRYNQLLLARLRLCRR